MEVFRENLGPLDEAAETLLGFDVLCLMRERQALPAALIDRLPRLKCVVTTGVWNAAIDLDAAERRGIAVLGTPNGRGQRATAELTWGLILASVRNIPAQDAGMRAGSWAGPPGRLLDGSVLGLIGFGTIAAMVADYAHAFGMRVLAASRSVAAADMPAHVAATDRDALLRTADVVSLHVRSSPENRGLIGVRELAAMKRDALLVNTSRASLVDHAALADALREGTIGGAALDVWDREPLPVDHPLRRAGPNLLLSPHMGYVARETMADFHAWTRDAVLAWLDGRCLGNLLRPGWAARPS
nr:D-2-hydroxyacid dehydrogenase family protein [Pinisolibacter aquiterrae]